MVDDSTLKVELNQPDSSFPYKVGDIAFLPISSKAIKDPEAYGKKPIGNGPYKVKSWTVNEDLELEKDPSYNGPRKPKNDGIDFRVYQSLNAAYSDLLAGNLDVLDSIPTVALGSYRKERRAKAVNRQGPSFVSFTSRKAWSISRVRRGVCAGPPSARPSTATPSPKPYSVTPSRRPPIFLRP